MPKEIYLEVKQRCSDILKGLFEVVDCPIEGPAKTDFGDLDFLVFGPKSPVASRVEIIDGLKHNLGAIKIIIDKVEEINVHLAIPWPTDSVWPDNTGGQPSPDGNSLSGMTAGQPGGTQPSPEDQLHSVDYAAPPTDQVGDALGNTKEKHIQLDIRVCDDIHRMRWILFKHAHGDIWSMIGATIRPYGLTVDELALWLRIPEVEKENRKRAKIFLTDDPDEILRFVDLDPSEYWRGPFGDVHAMARYVARCRMFSVPPPEPGDQGLPHLEGGPSGDRKKLKSNDRRRMKLRPGFRKWIDEFYPECRQKCRFLEKNTTRDEVTQEAFDKFGVEEDFKQRRQEFLLDQNKTFVWTTVIKGAIPQPEDPSNLQAIQRRGTLVKAFKKIILEDSNQYGIVAPDDLKDDDGFFVTQNVVDFIARNKGEVSRVAFEQQHAAYLEKKAREEQKAAEAKQLDVSSV